MEGFNLIFQDSECKESSPTKESVDLHDKMSDNSQNSSENKDDNGILSDDEEEKYERLDSVKKWQFNYNRSTCFSDNYPEINYKEDKSNVLSIAPGEGKLPTNILEEHDWDLKSFPCLHPDGKFSLHSNRPIKLSEQDYFNQRILNKDPRFCKNLVYLFAANVYIEKKTNGKKQRYIVY